MELARGREQKQDAGGSAPSLYLDRIIGGPGPGPLPWGPAAASVIAHHPLQSSVLAYVCGGVVVLYDSVLKQQLRFLRTRRPTSKALACLSFSRDGSYLAAGERGDAPELLVWETSSGRCIQALKGHKYGVGSVSFNGDGKLLVSTGAQYDGQLCLWDWQAGMLLSRQHTQGQVYSACFSSEDGACITSVGKAGHIRVWTFTPPSARARGGLPSSVTLVPRPVVLAKEYRTCDIVDVKLAPAADTSAPPNSVYALTSSGVLLLLRSSGRTLDKSVIMHVPAAFALAVSSTSVACACAGSVVCMFSHKTLALKAKLPRRFTDRGAHQSAVQGGPLAAGGSPGAGVGGVTSAALYPDARACSFDNSGDRLAVAYSDRCVVVWDVRNPAKIQKLRSVVAPADSVWDAALIPSWQSAMIKVPVPQLANGRAAAAASGGNTNVPVAVLATCAADGSISLWNMCLDTTASTAGLSGLPAAASGVSAAVTRTLRGVLYTKEGLTSAGSPSNLHKRCTPEVPLPAQGAAGAAARAGSPTGITTPLPALKCVRVSPTGRHVAAGDTAGNLRVWDLASGEQIMFMEAHDSEILTLDYSPYSTDGSGSCFLASGSRDTLIHIYDASRNYELVGTCEAHSAAVTAVRFGVSGRRLALLSCGADRCVIFRHVKHDGRGVEFAVYQREQMSRGVLYDLAMDASCGRAVTVGQDGQLRLFDVATGRAIKNWSQDAACGEAIRVTMDASGMFAVCSCMDGTVAVYDLESGSLMARGSGHAEACTAAVLLEDCRGLVSVSGDGCAFMWRLTPTLTTRMAAAAAAWRAQSAALAPPQQQHAAAAVPHVTPAPLRQGWAEPDMDLSATMLRIQQNLPIVSTDKLPRWAQQKLAAEGATGKAAAQPSAVAEPEVPQPENKWARPAAQPALQQQVVAVDLREQAARGNGGIADLHAEPAGAPPAVGSRLQVLRDGAPGSKAGSAGGSSCSPDVAAKMAAAAEAPRTWADEVEDDDEIMYYAPMEDEIGTFDVHQEQTQPLRQSDAGDLPSPVGHSQQDTAAQSSGEEAEPASGCGSNHVPGAAGLAAEVEQLSIKKDLFREHFDNLDQASATKAPPDPRRQSLSCRYRQAREGGGTAPPSAAGTPYLARVPVPAAINTARGGGADDADGGVTSCWTPQPAAAGPDRSLLPLKSPVLATADKQLSELAKLKERLQNTVTKQQERVRPVAVDATAVPMILVQPAAAASGLGAQQQPVAPVGVTVAALPRPAGAQQPEAYQPGFAAPTAATVVQPVRQQEGAAPSAVQQAPTAATVVQPVRQQEGAAPSAVQQAPSPVHDAATPGPQHAAMARAVMQQAMPSSFSGRSNDSPLAGPPGSTYSPTSADTTPQLLAAAEPLGLVARPAFDLQYNNPVYGASPDPSPLALADMLGAVAGAQQAAAGSGGSTSPSLAQLPGGNAEVSVQGLAVEQLQHACQDDVMQHALAAGCGMASVAVATGNANGKQLPADDAAKTGTTGAHADTPSSHAAAAVACMQGCNNPAAETGSLSAGQIASSTGATAASSSPGQRKPKVALPAIRPKPSTLALAAGSDSAVAGGCNQPAMPPDAVLQQAAGPAGAQAPALGAGPGVKSVQPVAGVAGSSACSAGGALPRPLHEYTGALAQLQQAAQEVQAMWSELATCGTAGGLLTDYRNGIQASASMLADLLQPVASAVSNTAPQQQQQPAAATMAPSAPCLLPASSPRISLAVLGDATAAVNQTPATQMPAVSASRRSAVSGASIDVNSSQVILEGLDLMVEDKVSQQLKMVEEVIMQRLMAKMQQQQKLAAAAAGVPAMGQS